MAFGITVSVLAPFVLAAFAPFVVRFTGRLSGWLLAILPAAIFVVMLGHYETIGEGGRVVETTPWVPTLGIDLGFHLDGLSLTFALLISGIGAFILIYAGGYLRGHPQLGRFLSFLLLFMGSMLGLVLADDLIALFVFWEMTSISSFLLIGFNHAAERSRRSAIQALVITGAGGLALLAGLIMLRQITGVTTLSELLVADFSLAGHPLYGWVLLFVLGGAFTKSAQFPLHVWLPNAMEAPTPVSAYLHSATMVKAGVYLLMRTHPILGGTDAWETILPAFGGTTLLVGTILAVRQTDLKLMLAYTTVASLGLLVMLVGLGRSEEAIEGAVLYLFAHSLFKGALFMVAGSVDHGTGTRDVRKLGGLARAMPITCAAAVLAALSMSGIPPFFGFIAKEILYEGILHTPTYLIWITVAVIGNALMMAVALAVAIKPFFGKRPDGLDHAHEGLPPLWVGAMTLALLGLAFGLSAYPVEPLLGANLAAVSGDPEAAEGFHLYLWHGINAALLFSILTIALGVTAFLMIDRLRGIVDRTLVTIGWGPDKGFDQLIAGLVVVSYRTTRLLQPGRLEAYMTVVLGALAVALILPMTLWNEWPTALPAVALRPHEWIVFAMAIFGLGAVIVAKTRLAAIVSLGIQGIAVAIVFMLFGAPDLSFTQFMVETLSVVILTLVLTRLRVDEHDRRGVGQTLMDGGIALACGLGFGLVLLSVLGIAFDGSLSQTIAEASRPAGHGRNIVNVILVDFRGIDTLGEIAVVMIAGLSIRAMIRLRGRPLPRALRRGVSEDAVL